MKIFSKVTRIRCFSLMLILIIIISSYLINHLSNEEYSIIEKKIIVGGTEKNSILYIQIENLQDTQKMNQINSILGSIEDIYKQQNIYNSDTIYEIFTIKYDIVFKNENFLCVIYKYTSREEGVIRNQYGELSLCIDIRTGKQIRFIDYVNVNSVFINKFNDGSFSISGYDGVLPYISELPEPKLYYDKLMSNLTPFDLPQKYLVNSVSRLVVTDEYKDIDLNFMYTNHEIDSSFYSYITQDGKIVLCSVGEDGVTPYKQYFYYEIPYEKMNEVLKPLFYELTDFSR